MILRLLIMLLVYRFHLISTCSSSSYCSSNSSSILWRRSCGIALWLGHVGCRCSAACRQQHGSIVTVNVKTSSVEQHLYVTLQSNLLLFFKNCGSRHSVTLPCTKVINTRHLCVDCLSVYLREITRRIFVDILPKIYL